jgi:hypothetical protein
MGWTSGVQFFPGVIISSLPSYPENLYLSIQWILAPQGLGYWLGSQWSIPDRRWHFYPHHHVQIESRDQPASCPLDISRHFPWEYSDSILKIFQISHMY